MGFICFLFVSCVVTKSSVSKKEQKEWLQKLREEKISPCDYGKLILAQDKLEQMKKELIK